MKLSVIIPTIDVPMGSGEPAPTLIQCIKSTLLGGHDDVEVLVGADGQLPAARRAIESLGDARVKYVEFERVHNWGNHQRNLLQDRYATGDVVLFMDHDDGYLEDALRIVAEDAGAFPGRLLFYGSTETDCGVNIRHVARRNHDGTDDDRDIAASMRALARPDAIAVAVPNAPWVPRWPDKKVRGADVDWVDALLRLDTHPVIQRVPVAVRRPFGRTWESEIV